MKRWDGTSKKPARHLPDCILLPNSQVGVLKVSFKFSRFYYVDGCNISSLLCYRLTLEPTLQFNYKEKHIHEKLCIANTFVKNIIWKYVHKEDYNA